MNDHSANSQPGLSFQGPGEMRALCRAFDWSTTSLGPVAQWSQPLRTVTQLVLASPFPAILLWGAELIQIYNDGYRELMGNKHPMGLGQPTRACWPEVWHINQPIYQRVWAGESLAFEDALYPITRSGQLQDAWFTLSYSPVLDETDQIAGVLVTVLETTERVMKQRHRLAAQELLQERQQQQAFLLKLSDTLRAETGVEAVGNRATQLIARQLGADRVYLVSLNPDDDTVLVTHEARREDMAPLLGSYRSSDFPAAIKEIFERTIIYTDVRTDARLTDPERLAFAGLGAVGFMAASIRRGSQTMIWAAGALSTQPRSWTASEVALFEDAIERTWAAIERARAEETLRQREQRLQRMVNVPRVGVLIFDYAGQLLDANDAFLDMVGYERAELATRTFTWHDFTPPQYVGESERVMANLLATMQGGPYEKEYFRKDGSKVWLMFVGANLGDGTLVEYAIDSSDSKRAEIALQQSEARQRAILQSAKDYAIFTTDLDRLITSWSRGAQAMFGYAPTDMMHQSADRLFTPEDRQQRIPQQEYQKAASQGEAENERWHIRQDGSRFYGSGVVTPLRDEAGSIIGLLKVMRDLTVQKRAEEALQQADRRKDEFLAMLAHELRNPMSTIRSGLQILTITDGNDQTSSDTIAMMNRQTDHLVRMVDDLLDVSRISQGKIELKTGQVNLVEMVAQAAESVQALYQEQGRRLRVDLPTAPIEVEGDGVRLSQVVTNLLTNGARYTGESGQVWLRVSHHQQEALIQVRDNGIGLSADQLETIFELFVQVDNSLARSKGGLGLGLTLVKRLVELHGGRVEAQSEGLGKGSTFTVYLPTVNTAPQPSFTPTEGSPESRTSAQTPTQQILVVDDNADAALTLSMLLKLKGYEVYTRHSGQAGLEATETLKPAVVLLDIGMPGMDGYETARSIRQQAWGRDILLIALTGYGGEEDKQRTREAGFDGHLVKPVDTDALQALLTSKIAAR